MQTSTGRAQPGNFRREKGRVVRQAEEKGEMAVNFVTLVFKPPLRILNVNDKVESLLLYG